MNILNSTQIDFIIALWLNVFMITVVWNMMQYEIMWAIPSDKIWQHDLCVMLDVVYFVVNPNYDDKRYVLSRIP